MHQRLYGPCDEAVDYEVVFFDIERGVAAFQIARPVAFDAVAQDQVLGARRGANRVGLHEAHPVKSAFQCRGREQTARDGKAPNVVKGHTVLF